MYVRDNSILKHAWHNFALDFKKLIPLQQIYFLGKKTFVPKSFYFVSRSVLGRKFISEKACFKRFFKMKFLISFESV
ncbi:hypothetical protein I3842_05G241400 [Carya illinoinensis]|uniref:Uncharacterized protein n=1 Tax=Carya illinoinensis TaxID=32201 RepID=A0A922F385_CARIL|nr:hypothetical protein I3842_05G241400 [Carya illinoinensis]